MNFMPPQMGKGPVSHHKPPRKWAFISAVFLFGLLAIVWWQTSLRE
ncbi:hypothetical protein [Erwinia psidii]|nr:hypothetical protein [Erwinia psidii]